MDRERHRWRERAQPAPEAQRQGSAKIGSIAHDGEEPIRIEYDDRGVTKRVSTGISVSLLLLVYRASRAVRRDPWSRAGPARTYTDIERHPSNDHASEVAVLRIESGL